MNLPTVQKFEQWAREHYRMAETVCMAQAFAQCEKERVAAYIKPLFDLYNFRVKPEWVDRLGREIITDPDDLYLSDLESPEYLDFSKQCDVEHRKHGFNGPQGHCPALIAEDLQRQAEYALLLVGGELFGVNFTEVYGERRKKALDLLLGACLKSDERKAA